MSLFHADYTKHTASTGGVDLQKTLGHAVSCDGVGLHSGQPVHMVVYPAAANSGIVFKRTDVPASTGVIPARYDLVTETRLGTTMTNEHGVSVSTVEHLMAALWGAGVDNAVIELDGPEVPIMDGSSEPFMFMLECGHVVNLSQQRRRIQILKTVRVQEGQSVAIVEPNGFDDEGCTISIEISFDHEAIGRQISYYDFRETTFKQSLSRARTFGFEHEVTALRNMGLARGGSLDNAIVVGEDGVLNKEGLRYADEFVRHKALDCIGDLFLAGLRIDGHFQFTRPGHAINNALLRAVFADKSAYRIVDSVQEPVMVPAVAAASSLPAYA